MPIDETFSFFVKGLNVKSPVKAKFHYAIQLAKGLASWFAS